MFFTMLRPPEQGPGPGIMEAAGVEGGGSGRRAGVRGENAAGPSQARACRPQINFNLVLVLLLELLMATTVIVSARSSDAPGTQKVGPPCAEGAAARARSPTRWREAWRQAPWPSGVSGRLMAPPTVRQDLVRPEAPIGPRAVSHTDPTCWTCHLCANASSQARRALARGLGSTSGFQNVTGHGPSPRAGRVQLRSLCPLFPEPHL